MTKTVAYMPPVPIDFGQDGTLVFDFNGVTMRLIQSPSEGASYYLAIAQDGVIQEIVGANTPLAIGRIFSGLINHYIDVAIPDREEGMTQEETNALNTMGI